MAQKSLKSALLQRMVNAGLNKRQVIDYSSLLGGQIGRLIFSVVFFISLAKTLTLGDFGLFAGAASVGLILSRLLGLGFVSPLYRVSTTRSRLIVTYTAGLLFTSALSLPFILIAAYFIHFLIFSQHISLQAFMLIVCAELLAWRTTEIVIIINNGINKFRTASALLIGGIAAKAAAAFWFGMSTYSDLDTWAWAYCASMSVVAVISIAFFYPHQKLRWAPEVWLSQRYDAIGVCSAEVMFYVQSELDKVLVLALAGDTTAGLYAIIIRIVDLTALPMRSLNTMVIQWIMKARRAGKSSKTGIIVDAGIAAVSVTALIVLSLVLLISPTLLGENVALAASFLLFVLLVPGFRNAIEYHTELLYAHERMMPRVLLLIYLTIAKAGMLTILFTMVKDFTDAAIWLNAIFAILYSISALVTYKLVMGDKPTDIKLQPDGMPSN